MTRLKETIAAVFANEERGRHAIDMLRSEGFHSDEINFVTRDNRQGGTIGDHNVTSGTTWGAGIGAAGGILATAGALAVPGIGPLLALGPIGATIGAAAVGGLAGALVDYGIPQQESRQFERDIKRGEALALIATEQTQRAEQILRREGARQIHVYRGQHVASHR